MSALHLCFDGNFINKCLEVFEKYYPGQNLFLVNKEKDQFEMLQSDRRLLGVPFVKKNFPLILQLCSENNIDKIILHGLKSDLVDCLKFLKQNIDCRVYWIFWGYELYFTLGNLGKYKLFDGFLNAFLRDTYYSPNRLSFIVKRFFYGKRLLSDVFKEALTMIDYFCFWNYKDYELLQAHFHTNIKYKYFAYMASEETAIKVNIEDVVCKKSKTLMINHQASNTGNHNTVMKKIAWLDTKNDYKKIVPLSYGSSRIRKLVLRQGQHLFKEQFNPILEYMPRDKYFELMSSVEVAVFGQKRQEASGNISTLLKNGVKVFLREKNNLLQYYREKGYIIFSFEKDLNSIDDLKPLSLEEQAYNRDCSVRNRIYYDRFMPSFFEE